MAPAVLTVRGSGQSWQVELDPAGTIVGRGASCDVVIGSKDVSRRHARFFADPSGKWICEDLGSSNGTFVNGRRVASCPVLPGDVVEIGPASLSLGQTAEPQTDATVLVPGPNIIVEDFGTEVLYDKPRLDDCPTQPCPDRLEQVGRRLSGLTSATTLYPEVCRLLAEGPKTAAAVFRVPATAPSAPKVPDVRACHFGSSLEDTMAEAGSAGHPSHLAFRVSHRLLDAVRAKGQPLMAKSIYTCDTEVTVSLIDEQSPRALMCAPLGSVDDAVDLLYVDVPIDERCAPGPEEMFAFVQAVARLVVAARAKLNNQPHEAHGEDA